MSQQGSRSPQIGYGATTFNLQTSAVTSTSTSHTSYTSGIYGCLYQRQALIQHPAAASTSQLPDQPTSEAPQAPGKFHVQPSQQQPVSHTTHLHQRCKHKSLPNNNRWLKKEKSGSSSELSNATSRRSGTKKSGHRTVHKNRSSNSK